jgi:phosphatidylserine/phosphatidylglycerophosphate/cardiolipin synthase-like enzyme
MKESTLDIIINAAIIFLFILIFSGGVFFGLDIANDTKNNAIKACFTPGKHCDEFISGYIGASKSELLIQAYHLTNRKIIVAMCYAQFRGVNVTLILDKAAKKELLKIPSNCYGKVYIDYKKAIAHNKVIVIDKQSVITGSYNFTEAAEHRNVENIVWINMPEIAKQYRDNFFNRLNQSK